MLRPTSETGLAKLWSGGRDLNPQPSPWKSETLPLSYPRPVLQESLLVAGLKPGSHIASLRKPNHFWSLGPGLNR